MKKSKLSSIIFLLILSLTTCVDKVSIFAEKIRSYVEKRTKPANANNLVDDIQNKLTILSYTLSLKQLEEVKIKYDLSDSLVLQIRAAPFVRTSGVKKIEEKSQFNFFTYEESLGAALKENDGKISFALIKTKSFAKLKPKYEKYPSRECHRVWIFFKECHDVERQRERELTQNEKIIVTEATKYSSINSILEAVDILKRGNYELYMSDTGTIFSPDHKSVAHLTYFGNIAIGPISELNSILPMDYEYVYKSSNSDGGKRLVKQTTGDVVEFKYYPKEKKGGVVGDYEKCIMKNGKYFKFNYVNKNKIPPKFPTKFLDFIREESSKGPYVLEVLKNGNVIIYSKNNPKTNIWSTNTAYKGKGPYNLHLTNNKKLILEDSEGKILYQSPDYKECPTVYYKNSNSGYVYNGQLGKLKDKPIAKKDLGIYNDRGFIMSIAAREKKSDSNNNNNYNKNKNNNNYYPPYSESSDKIDLLRVDLSPKNKDFDVCYTAFFNCVGWTQVYCNGEIVGMNGLTQDCYIKDFLIYIKEKWESVPNISSVPKYIANKDDLKSDYPF